ncbi:squalene/phytoene synthase family protein [Sulfitobacter sp. LCG007]
MSAGRRTLSPDIVACARIVERGDPLRFRAAMAAPVAARDRLFPIYAFNVEVARAPWLTSEPMIAEMRLQWWRDVAQEIAQGGPVRRHEVATPLARAVTPGLAPLLDEIAASRRWDIHGNPFEDRAALERHIDGTAGNLAWLAACALGEADEGVIRDAAFAAGLAAWLRAVPELTARGRHPLPDRAPDAISSLAAQGLKRLARARSARAAVSSAARPALLILQDTGPALRAARRAPGLVATGGLPPPGLTARAAFLIRTLSGRW